MDARERFKSALAKTAYEDLIKSGWDLLLFDEALERALEQSGATQSDGGRALQEMAADYLLVEEDLHHRATLFWH